MSNLRMHHKDRNVTLLVVGRSVSQFGTASTVFIIPWLFLHLTGSGTQTGLMFAIGFLPYIAVSLPAGVFADRLDRKMLMMWSDAARLVLLSALPVTYLVTGQVPFYLLYVTQGGVSALTAIFDASYSAYLPNVVAKDALREVNNTLQTWTSFSRMLGPIAGGAVAALIGMTNALLLDVCSYVVSIWTLLYTTRSSVISLHITTKASFWKDMSEGLVTVWHFRPIRYMMLFAALVNLVGPGMDVALLYRIQHELHMPSEWAGIVMTGLAAGMVVGGLVQRRLGQRVDLRRMLILSSGLQVLPPIMLSVVQNVWGIFLIQVFIGVLLVAWNVTSVTLRQMLVPNERLGRCSSVFRLTAWVSIPFGDALAGWLSQSHGSHTYFFIAGCVLFVVFALQWRIMPEQGIARGGSHSVAHIDHQEQQVDSG